MADATFDGDTLTITLPSSQQAVDVKVNLYTPWKEFSLLGQNLRFPQAFRTVGGDELTPGIDAGAYFFIRNDLGWRIKPAEEDATVFLTGNLAPQDSSLPILVPTDGDFSVLIAGLQPITQSVEAILLAQQLALYEGEVWIDTTLGVPGTTFPIGTSSVPVSNVADAFTIADTLGFRHFHIVNSTLVMDRAGVNCIFEGFGSIAVINIAGQDMSGAEFRSIDVTGNFLNSPTAVRLNECNMVAVRNFLGFADGCGISTSFSVKAGTTTLMRCYSSVIGSLTPVIDCQDLQVDLALRAYTGGAEIKNFSNAANTLSIDLVSGHAIFGATCSDGDPVLRGVGKLTNSSITNFAANLDTDGFIDGQEIEVIHQMQAGNVDISLDDETVTVFEQGSVVDVLATFSISTDGRVRRRTS